MHPDTHALIVIDVQNDFCPGGALAVDGGDQIVPGINALMEDFSAIVLTQDWHPFGHSSFASEHPGAAPMSVVEFPYGPQVLWPDHCIQSSPGAAFHAGEGGRDGNVQRVLFGERFGRLRFAVTGLSAGGQRQQAAA